MTRHFTINGRRIGPGEPTYVIAEMSANHLQDFNRAVSIVRAAKASGADAIKLQTYTPDTMTIDSETEPFRISGTQWSGRTLYALYEDAYTPWDWHPMLKKAAEDEGLHFFSTPFDYSAVEFLENLDVPAFKIASFENVDLPLIRRVAQTNRPVIISTGMATLAEIEEAVRTARSKDVNGLALLKCTSAYPARPDDANLRTIPHMAEAFDVPTGLSDHTLNLGVPVAAIALGACIVEKHITLARSDGGPDSAFSLEPAEFKSMVEAIRTAERALGSVTYEASPHEAKSRVFRRSLFVVKPMRKGDTFTNENVRSIRPDSGLHTRYLDEFLGRKARADIEKGTPLSWCHLC